MVTTAHSDESEAPVKATRRSSTAQSAAKSAVHSPREVEDHLSGKYALAKGPLGIVLAGLLLVEAVLALVVRSNLPTAITSIVVCAMVLLVFMVFGGFFYVWLRMPPGWMHPPSAFRSDEMWFAAMQFTVRPSEPLLGKPASAVVTVMSTDIYPNAKAVPGSVVRLGKPAPTTEAAPPPAGLTRASVRPGAEVDPGSVVLQGVETFATKNDAWTASELQGGSVNSTLLMDLSNLLAGKSEWDYLTVNADHAWLLSRLFIFVSMYSALRPLPCIVFVSKQGGTDKLLGIADPAKLCSAIARLNPHFNTTLAAILIQQNIPITISGAVDEKTALEIMDLFVHSLQSQEDHSADPDWSRLSASRGWECSRWLTPEMVTGDFAATLFDPKAAFFTPDPGEADQDFVIEIMKRDSPFVALTGENGEFLELYDKRRIIDELKNRLNAPAA